jgi:hypothetical protein
MEKKEIESILINWYYIGHKLHEPKSVNTVFIGKYLNKRIIESLKVQVFKD